MVEFCRYNKACHKLLWSREPSNGVILGQGVETAHRELFAKLSVGLTF